MIDRFMISAAAVALIAGSGFANAQGTGMSHEAPSAGSTAQQSAPSSERGSSAGQVNHDATEPGKKSTQSEEKSPAAGKNQRADENMKGPKSKSMSSENDNTKGGKDMKAEGGKNNMSAQKGAEGQKGAESKSQTTGQAGAGAKLSTEQRTKITSVIKEQHIAPVTNVNFAISIGTRVPHEISFHPLPVEIVTVYPDWRGFEFFLVRDQIVVVNPRTFEIVAVLDA